MMDTKWHRDTIYLWDKSDATSMLELMTPELIRDGAAYWLTPMDMVNFVVATGVMLPERDMAKYTSPFRYVITDRKWMLDKIERGHTFTIMGSSLLTLMDANIPMGGLWYPCGTPPRNGIWTCCW